MIKSTLITFGILIVITSFLFTGYTSFASTPLWFGGLVIKSEYCSDSGNFLLTISEPINKQLVWVPGTPQFEYGSLPRAGIWVMGVYIPDGVCLQRVEYDTVDDYVSYNGNIYYRNNIYYNNSSNRYYIQYGNPIGTITPFVGSSF